MGALVLAKGRVYKGSGAQVMFRAVANDGTNVQQADLSSIAYSVFDKDGDRATPIVNGTALTVSSVVFDTLQTDARWTEDDTGYNFRHEVPETAFPTGGHTYRIEYTFNPVTGEDWVDVAEIDVVDTMT